MDAASPPTRSLRLVRPTWLWGGIAVIASALPGMAWSAIASSGTGPALDLAAAALWCAGFVLFAVGRDSVVALRVPAMIVLFAVALWPLIVRSVVPAIPLLQATPDGANEGAVMIASVVVQLIPVVLAAVAVVQVWWAGVVPHAYRWVPAIAWALCVVPPLAQYAVVVSPGFAATDGLIALFSVIAILHAIGVVGLGVVAIVAALQPQQAAASTTAVYPPAP